MARTYTPDETRLTIAKMIGLLGSDQDGEVLAATRQIKKLMNAEGLTFGDLKNWIAGYKAHEQIEQAAKRDPRRGWRQDAEARERDAQPTPTLNETANRAGAILSQHSAKLNPAERRFISNILTRATAGGVEFTMTPKQFSWFNDIAKKCLNVKTDKRA